MQKALPCPTYGQVQTHLSFPKMQLQVGATSSAENFFLVNKPGHISKCKGHGQTCRASLGSPRICLNKIPRKDSLSRSAEPGSLLVFPQSHLHLFWGGSPRPLSSPVDTTEVAVHWIHLLTSTACLVSEMARLESSTPSPSHTYMKGAKFLLLLLTHTDGNQRWRGDSSASNITFFSSVSLFHRMEE